MPEKTLGFYEDMIAAGIVNGKGVLNKDALVFSSCNFPQEL